MKFRLFGLFKLRNVCLFIGFVVAIFYSVVLGFIQKVSENYALGMVFHPPDRRLGVVAECDELIPQKKYSSRRLSFFENKEGEEKFICLYFPTFLFLEKKQSYQNTIVLHSHGSGDDVLSAYSYLMFVEMKFPVILYDYPGYGASGGTPSLDGVVKSLEVAFEFVVETLEIPPMNIILYGYSLGSYPVIQFVSYNNKYSTNKYDSKIAGVVLHSSFSSSFRTGYDWLVVNNYGIQSDSLRSLVCWIGDRFLSNLMNNIDHIGNLREETPVMILHGDKDDYIDIRHGRENFEKLSVENKEFHILHGQWHGSRLLRFHVDRMSSFFKIKN